MSNRVATILILAAAITVAAVACSHDAKPTACHDFVSAPGVIVLLPAIQVSVRNDQGVGVAPGTNAVLVGQADSTPRSYVEDSVRLGIFVVPGTYTVRLSKPLYRDTTVANIVVQSGDCGTVQTTNLSVTLHALPTPATVRSVVASGATFLERPGAEAHLSALVDAKRGVSRAVRWSVDDTSLATIDQQGVVVARCSRSGGTVTTTVRSVVDTSVFSIIRFAVAPADSC